jgi:TRAP-type mannitol/chloroaromatic compound transport system permease small subunit
MERGMDTAWMPYMYPIKFALFVGFIFLLIQGVSEVLKCVYAIKNRRWP